MKYKAKMYENEGDFQREILRKYKEHDLVWEAYSNYICAEEIFIKLHQNEDSVRVREKITETLTLMDKIC